MSGACPDACSCHTQTRWYRAPELLVGAPYGFEVDIWAIGEGRDWKRGEARSTFPTIMLDVR